MKILQLHASRVKYGLRPLRQCDLLAVMKVKVTKKDILEGNAGSAETCPIALALERKFGRKPCIAVSTSGITIGCKEYRVPEHIAEWIDDFDSAKKENRSTMKPFTFTLNER